MDVHCDESLTVVSFDVRATFFDWYPVVVCPVDIVFDVFDSGELLDFFVGYALPVEL